MEHRNRRSDYELKQVIMDHLLAYFSESKPCGQRHAPQSHLMSEDRFLLKAKTFQQILRSVLPIKGNQPTPGAPHLGERSS